MTDKFVELFNVELNASNMTGGSKVLLVADPDKDRIIKSVQVMGGEGAEWTLAADIDGFVIADFAQNLDTGSEFLGKGQVLTVTNNEVYPLEYVNIRSTYVTTDYAIVSTINYYINGKIQAESFYEELTGLRLDGNLSSSMYLVVEIDGSFYQLNPSDTSSNSLYWYANQDASRSLIDNPSDYCFAFDVENYDAFYWLDSTTLFKKHTPAGGTENVRSTTIPSSTVGDYASAVICKGWYFYTTGAGGSSSAMYALNIVNGAHVSFTGLAAYERGTVSNRLYVTYDVTDDVFVFWREDAEGIRVCKNSTTKTTMDGYSAGSNATVSAYAEETIISEDAISFWPPRAINYASPMPGTDDGYTLRFIGQAEPYTIHEYDHSNGTVSFVGEVAQKHTGRQVYNAQTYTPDAAEIAATNYNVDAITVRATGIEIT